MPPELTPLEGLLTYALNAMSRSGELSVEFHCVPNGRAGRFTRINHQEARDALAALRKAADRTSGRDAA